jgi:hypothetical protein
VSRAGPVPPAGDPRRDQRGSFRQKVCPRPFLTESMPFRSPRSGHAPGRPGTLAGTLGHPVELRADARIGPLVVGASATPDAQTTQTFVVKALADLHETRRFSCRNGMRSRLQPRGDERALPPIKGTVARGVGPSKKVTIPVGTTELEGSGLTAVVNVTGCPNGGAFELTASSVDVAAFFTRTIKSWRASGMAPL